MLTVHGKGGHGKVVADAAQEEVRFTDDADGTYPNPCDEYIIAIGDNAVRRGMTATVRVIHPTAVVSEGAEVQVGAYVGALAVVNPGATVQEGAIINTGAIVEHDCWVGRWAHVAPGATLCGNVSVGDCALVGAGAVVRPGIHIGAHSVVGCGSVVVKDIPAGEVWCGQPASLLRKGDRPGRGPCVS